MDATGARLAQADLEGAELHQAIFDEADLTGASLRSVLAPGIRLARSVLDHAILDDAELPGADLSGAAVLGRGCWSVVTKMVKELVPSRRSVTPGL